MRGGKSPTGWVSARVAVGFDFGGGGGVGNEKASVNGSVRISWGRAVEGGETHRSRSGSTGRSRGMLGMMCCDGGAV